MTSQQGNESLKRGEEEKLPKERKGFTQRIEGLNQGTAYIHTGQYSDGRIGELFISMSDFGIEADVWSSYIALAVSIGLQYGVPLEKFVEAFVHRQTSAGGRLLFGHVGIPIISQIFEILQKEYIAKDTSSEY